MDHTNTDLGKLIADASADTEFGDLSREQLVVLLQKALAALSAVGELASAQSAEVAGLYRALEQVSHGCVGLLFNDLDEPLRFDPAMVSHDRMCDLLELSLQQMQPARPMKTH